MQCVTENHLNSQETLTALVDALIAELELTMARNTSLVAINRRLLATNKELLNALGSDKHGKT
jgi:hypothetical protein